MDNFAFISGGGGGGGGGSVDSVSGTAPIQVTGTTNPIVSITTATQAVAGSVSISAQTFGGVKTFASTPICANVPTTGSQLVNKDYVDGETSVLVSSVSVSGLPLSSTGGTTPVISIADASASASGVVNTSAQSFAGVKTFISAPQYSGLPSSSNDLTNKSYVDNVAAGLSVRASCVAATTVAIGSGLGFANGSTCDTVTLATGDRVLLKNEPTPANNGIYVIGASAPPTRALDYDTGSEVVAGTFTTILGGTSVNKNTQWAQTTSGTITIGVTPLVFSQLGITTGVTSIVSPVSGNKQGDVNLYTTDINGLTTSLDSKSPLYATINPQPSAYTLALTDAQNVYIRHTSGTNTTLTIPLNSTVAFTAGTTICGIQAGAGQITIQGVVGVTLNYASSANKTRAQFSSYALIKVNTNEWDLVGDLSP